MAYPPGAQPTDLLNETDAETGAEDAAGLEAEGGAPGEGEHAARHNALAAAVNDIVAELGANPGGASVTVMARLEALDTLVGTKAATAAVAEALAAKASKEELTAGLAGKASSGSVTTEKERAEAAELLKLVKTANLSDLSSASTARTNLGLGTAATKASTEFASTTHAAAHQLGAADALALSQYDPYEQLPYVLPMGLWPGTTVGPTAKRAYFLRFTVAKKRVFKFGRFAVAAVGSGEDKVDVGIYSANGAKLERLGSNGGTKVLTTGLAVKALEFTAPVTCEPGVVYFISTAWETITGTPQVAALLNNSGLYGDIAGTGTLANRIQLFKAESFPLPTSVESLGGSTPVPWVVPSES